MEKLKSSLLNMVISLTLVSMVLSSVLGFVYVSTKDKIEKAKNEKILKAIEYVLPEFNNHPLNDTINIKRDDFLQGYDGFSSCRLFCKSQFDERV